MIVALFVLASPLRQDISDWACPRFQANGFVRIHSSVETTGQREEFSAGGSRADGATFMIGCRFDPEPATEWAEYSLIRRFFAPGLQAEPHNVFRGEEVGEKSYCYLTEAGAPPFAVAYVGNFAVQLSLTYPVNVVNNTTTAIGIRPEDLKLVALVMRQALSRASGYGQGKEWSDGEDYGNPVKLSSLNSLGFTVTGDANADLIELKKAGHRLVLHTGSRRVELDGQTLRMRKALMIKGDEVYVPRGLTNRF